MFLNTPQVILLLILSIIGVLFLIGAAVMAIVFLTPEIISEFKIRKHKAEIEYEERIQKLEEEYKLIHSEIPCGVSGRVVDGKYIPCEKNPPKEEDEEWDEEFEKQVEKEEKAEEEAIWDEEEQIEAEKFTEEALKEDPTLVSVIEEALKEESLNAVENSKNEFQVQAPPEIENKVEVPQSVSEEKTYSTIHLDSLSGLIAITTTPKFGIFADATGKWYAVDKNNEAIVVNTIEELNKIIY